jgi:two-component sensor histidine kinase
MRLSRTWLVYGLAWVPFLLTLFLLMHASGAYTTAAAARNAFTMVLVAAFAGAVVGWWAERRAEYTRKPAFFIGHAVGALAYSGVFCVTMFFLLLWDRPYAEAVETARGFMAWQFVYSLFMYGVIAGVFHALATTRRLREARQRAADAERLRMQAELVALRGRLQPHFLFNTLNSITTLIQRDPKAAQSAVLQLSDLLRAVLDSRQHDDVALAEEWRLVQRYLDLEKLRYGDRLRVAYEATPAALHCQVPSLILQPLVENAIHHAIAPSSRGGTVRIRATIAEDRLQLLVADDGPGADLAQIEAGEGLGLSTVRQRLALRHPQHTFAIHTSPGTGFRVNITLPARQE